MKRVRKWVSVLVALMLLASLSVPAALAADLYYETAQKSDIRKGADESFDTIVTVPKGDVVLVTSMWYAQWWKVQYTNADGQTFGPGYMLSSVLKKSKKTSNKKENLAPLGCYSTTAELNFRAGPGTNYESRTAVPKGNVVNVTDTSDGYWFKATFINAKGKKFADGYVSSKYLKKASEPYNVKSATELRKKASKKGKVICKLPKGAYVQVTADYSKNWYKIRYTDYQGTTSVGFVLKSKLKKGTVTNKPYQQVDPDAAAKKRAQLWRTKTRYVVSSKSKLLKKANKKAKVVTTLPKNAVVAVTDSSGKYYKVIYSDSKNKKYEGYLLKKVAKKKYKDPKAGEYMSKVITQVRATERKTGEVLAELPQYTLFNVLDSFEKGWYRVSYTDTNGKKVVGFVQKGHAKKYVETKAGTYYTKAATSLRKAANNTASEVTALPQGAMVSVKQTYNPNWYLVSYTNEKGTTCKGFVAAGHLAALQKKQLAYVTIVPTQLRKLPNQTANLTLDEDVPAEQAVTVIDTPFANWYWACVTTAAGKTVTGYIFAPHLMTKEQYEAEKQAQQNQNLQSQNTENEEEPKAEEPEAGQTEAQKQPSDQAEVPDEQTPAQEEDSAEEEVPAEEETPVSQEQTAEEETPAEETPVEEESQQAEPQAQELPDEEAAAEEQSAA